MSYVVDSFTGDRAREFGRAAPPLGVGFAEGITSRIDKIIWEASSFCDPGGDWNRFTAYDEDGRILDVKTVEGY